MKLTDLEPRWWSDKDDKSIAGISFLCPHCRESRLAVRVDHAAPHIIQVPDGSDLHFHAHNEEVWQMSGEAPSFDGYAHGGFEHVTLSPSVDASKHGHWHGFIVGGEVR